MINLPFTVQFQKGQSKNTKKDTLKQNVTIQKL